MKLKAHFLPGVFSLEFLIRPEDPAVEGGQPVRRGAAGERPRACVCIVVLNLCGANAACAEDGLHFCI